LATARSAYAEALTLDHQGTRGYHQADGGGTIYFDVTGAWIDGSIGNWASVVTGVDGYSDSVVGRYLAMTVTDAASPATTGDTANWWWFPQGNVPNYGNMSIWHTTIPIDPDAGEAKSFLGGNLTVHVNGAYAQ